MLAAEVLKYMPINVKQACPPDDIEVQGLRRGDTWEKGQPAHEIRQQKSERHAGCEAMHTCRYSMLKRKAMMQVFRFTATLPP